MSNETQTSLAQQAEIKQTVERTVTQSVSEVKTYTAVKLDAVSGKVLPNGKILATARLLPVNDAGGTGDPVIVAVPDLQALAAQRPEVAPLLASVKTLVFELARQQGKIGPAA
ncbi:MAG: hypothetical protein LBD30_04785 [Verrucomicrobiales bacterium]|jgi:hypothetical protein|nr:hypothetical protein [Verrucomicrobiales bacterium]